MAAGFGVCLFLLALDVWLWVAHWRRVSRLQKGEPIEADRTRSCLVTVSASPQDVTDACESWAADLGWHRTDRPGDLTFMLLGRLHPDSWTNLRDMRPAVAVRTCARGDTTDVVFAMSMATGYSTAISKRICDTFAHGVCSDLAGRGFAVSPPEFAVSRQNRARLKIVATWRARAQLAVVLCGLVLFFAYLVSLAAIGGEGYPVFGAFALLAAGLSLLCDLVRFRYLGARVRVGLILVPLLAVALIAVVVETALHSG